MSGISHADGRGSKPPSRLWYLAAVLAVLAGFTGGALLGYSKLEAFTRGMQQVVVPGEAVLTLEPGHYAIFHESESLVDGGEHRAGGRRPGACAEAAGHDVEL
jgi:hypothetical protein